MPLEKTRRAELNGSFVQIKITMIEQVWTTLRYK